MEENHKELVVQSNRLIEAKYKLSVEEQKIIKILISKIQKNDKDFKKYEFRIKDLAEVLGMTHDNPYVVLRGVTRRLITRVLEFRNPETRTLLQTAWLSSASYIEGEGTVSLCFDPELKPLLLELKTHFTKYELGQIMQFRGQYTIRFFELRKSYLGRKTNEVKFTLKELWKMLGLRNDEYSIFWDFKRKALEPARTELLEKTGKSFTWEPIKQGRGGKIVAVKFVFDKDDEESVVEDKKSHKNDSVKEAQTSESTQSESVKSRKQEDIKSNLSDNEKSILDKLMSLGISDRKSRFILEEYTVEKIQEKIDILDRKGNGVKNSAGFLIQALDEDWTDERIEQERNDQEKRRRAEQVARRKAELKNLSEKYDVFRRDAALTEYQNLTDDAKDKLKNEFISVQMSATKISKDKIDFDNRFFRGFVISKFKLPTEDDFFKNEGLTLSPEDIKLWNEIRS